MYSTNSIALVEKLRQRDCEAWEARSLHLKVTRSPVNIALRGQAFWTLWPCVFLSCRQGLTWSIQLRKDGGAKSAQPESLSKVSADL